MQFTIILFAMFSLSSCGYNKIVELEESANKQWGQVESAYQRRADLMPKLLAQAELIGGNHKSKINAAMEKANIKLSVDDLKDSKKIQEYQDLQGKVDDLVNNYLREIQSDPAMQQSATDLRAQLEGAENRIGFERKKFNESASEFNAYIRKVPQNFTSGVMGFDEMAYFEAKQGAR